MNAEDTLIARYFQPLARDPGARGLRDDAALLQATSDDLVVTTDAIVEGVHFLPDDPPDTIARKALRVNLSDLAAKGATPAGFVLTLALQELREAFLEPFARALGEDSVRFNCPLLGGDTVSTPGPMMISITAFGRIASGRMVGRDGAKPGDVVFVSGTIGDAALGLDVLRGRLDVLDDAQREFLTARYRVPQPRSALAMAVRDHASAAMDISDGLAGDLAKLCAASGVSVRIDTTRIPLSIEARAALDGGAMLERLIGGGDDYEILCAVPENRVPAFEAAAKTASLPVTAIGVVVAGYDAPIMLDRLGRPVALKSRSYSHF